MKKSKPEVKLEIKMKKMLELESSPKFKEWSSFQLLSDGAKKSMQDQWDAYYIRVSSYWNPLIATMREMMVKHDYVGLRDFTAQAKGQAPAFNKPLCVEPLHFKTDLTLKTVQDQVRNLYWDCKNLCTELGYVYSEYLTKFKEKDPRWRTFEKEGL